MKKVLSILFLAFCVILSCSAQVGTQWFRTTSFAYAEVDMNGHYTWSDWEKSDMNVCFNTQHDVITIYSPTKQVFSVYDTYNNGQTYTDSSGGQNVKFYAVDRNGSRCEIRLRMERNGNSQIYIDYSDAALVYNVVRIQ